MENTTRQREYNVNEMENAMKQREEPTSHGRRHQHARQNIPPHPKKTRRISELYCDDATRGQCTQPGGLGRHNDIPVTGRIRRHDNAGGTSIPPSPERDEMTLVDSKKLIDEVERILAESSPSNSSELERAKNLFILMINVKREFDSDGDSSRTDKRNSELHPVNDDADYQTPKRRRGIRSRYLAVKNMIEDEREEIARPDSDKFNLIFDEMASLHQQGAILVDDFQLYSHAPLQRYRTTWCANMYGDFLVNPMFAHWDILITKPREQVADAKALLEITKSLVMSVRTTANGGITPSDFVTHILKKFGGQVGPSNSTEDCSRNSVAWNDIGVAASHVFRAGYGCCTMMGPMDAKIKQRKVINRRKRVTPTELARPEELCGGSGEERTETDKHMLTMFNILRVNKVVKLENLVLNRNSFGQTVENLFALSFLVRDGRAEIKVNEAGWQLVAPRNAPASNSVRSGDVAFSHFVFRFDFNDWKLMVRTVEVGEELMPHRNKSS
ncbi:unnamed protein product [Sphenostylis stenocarpa]|uniref:Non-structural maintenance of chromosomes element 4 n=1 Tax=Sphenostylis stenocarpa TaxID=92480 RepID=A0AA86RRG5_9FABA|nr:unnamed protein product [Sphenostylis stenocarpa]